MAPPSGPSRRRSPTARHLLPALTLAVLIGATLAPAAAASPLGSAAAAPVAGGSVSATTGPAVTPGIEASGVSHLQANGCTVTADDQVSCLPAAPAPPPNATGPAPVAWTNLSSYVGSPPAARWLGVMVWDPVDHYLVLFGGCNCPSQLISGLYSDTWTFVNNTWTQIYPNNSPQAGYAMDFAWDTGDGYGVLFGGHDGVTAGYNETWTFLHGQWTDLYGTTGPTPPGRWAGCMAYDAKDGYVVLYGGKNGNATVFYNDTWAFHAGTWKQLNPSGNPPTRLRTQMVYDAADGYVVLFGGCSDQTCSPAVSDTWIYTNDTWKSLTGTTHPSARCYTTMAYSPDAGEVFLFGGSLGPPASGAAVYSDTWAFSAGNWTNITKQVQGAPRSVAYSWMMGYDAVDNETIFFGGEWESGTQSNTTWSLGGSLLGKLVISPTVIDLNQSTTVNATALAFAKYVNYTYPVLPPGCAGGNVSTFKCIPSATGSWSIEVKWRDSTNSPINRSTVLLVNPDVHLTSFTVSHPVVTRGVSVQFEVAATPGTGILSYRYTNLPSGCFTNNVHNLTCTPSGTASGTYAVGVTVTDQAAYAVNATLDLVVNPTPLLTAVQVSKPTVDVGQPFTLWANVSGGTLPLHYLYSNLPQGCVAPDASNFTCTPTGSAVGTIYVMATDSYGYNTTGSVNLTVNVDPAIVSSAISPTALDVGQPILVWVNATGGTGVLVYNYTNEPPGCVIGDHPTGTCSPTVAGSYSVTATVTDELGFVVSQILTVQVNPPPTFVSLTATPANVDVGQNVTLHYTATGGTAPYKLVWTGLPVGCSAPIVAGTSGPSITCSTKTAQAYTVSATETDLEGESAPGTVTYTVNPLPTITAFSPSSPTTQEKQTFDLLVNVVGGTAPYSYAYSNLPTGCATQNASVLTCTPTAAGSYNVTVVVTDTVGGSATSYAHVTITAPPSSSSPTTSVTTGTSPTVLYALIGLLIVVILVVAVLAMRRRTPPPKASAPAVEKAPYDESE